MINFHRKALPLRDEQVKWFLEMESIPGEDAVRTAEMTTNDSEYYINLVKEAAARCKRTEFNFEISPTMGQMVSNSTACCRERKSQLRWQPWPSYFKKLPQPPSFSNLPTDQQPASRQDPPTAKRYRLTKDSDDD